METVSFASGHFLETSGHCSPTFCAAKRKCWASTTDKVKRFELAGADCVTSHKSSNEYGT